MRYWSLRWTSGAQLGLLEPPIDGVGDGLPRLHHGFTSDSRLKTGCIQDLGFKAQNRLHLIQGTKQAASDH